MMFPLGVVERLMFAELSTIPRIAMTNSLRMVEPPLITGSNPHATTRMMRQEEALRGWHCERQSVKMFESGQNVRFCNSSLNLIPELAGTICKTFHRPQA